jgi:predicted DNA-binding antitoxin AbrB/MazE fold protein
MSRMASTALKATYEDGVLKLERPLELPEHSRVELVILGRETTTEDDDPTGWKTAERFIGFIKDAPRGEPIAEEHDRYLYGE